MAKLANLVSRMQTEAPKNELDDQLKTALLTSMQHQNERSREAVPNQLLLEIILALSSQVETLSNRVMATVKEADAREGVKSLAGEAAKLKSTLNEVEQRLGEAAKSGQAALEKTVAGGVQALKAQITGLKFPETDLTVLAEALDELGSRPKFDDSKILAAIQKSHEEEWEFTIDRDPRSREIQSVVAKRVS